MRLRFLQSKVPAFFGYTRTYRFFTCNNMKQGLAARPAGHRADHAAGIEAGVLFISSDALRVGRYAGLLDGRSLPVRNK
jgi:hypothetical protein